MPENNKKILVCAIGNRIMGDDGFAQHVLEFLENIEFKKKLKDNVDFADFATANFTMANLLSDYDAVIFIDIIKLGDAFGTVHEIDMKRKEVRDDLNPLTDLYSFSFHESRLEELIVFAKTMNYLPEKIFIIGCEPKTIEPSVELSHEAEKSVEKVANRILELIKKINKE